MSTAEAPPTKAFISMTEACKRLSRSPSWILRAAVDGMIRTKVEPGRTRRFSASDIERLKTERDD